MQEKMQEISRAMKEYNKEMSDLGTVHHNAMAKLPRSPTNDLTELQKAQRNKMHDILMAEHKRLRKIRDELGTKTGIYAGGVTASVTENNFCTLSLLSYKFYATNEAMDRLGNLLLDFSNEPYYKGVGK